MITGDDKPVARMAPEGRPKLDEVRRAAAGLRAIRLEMANRPGFRAISDKEIRDARTKSRPRASKSIRG